MIWPFSPKAPPPSPPADGRVWNEDWKIGDTAECIVDFDGWHSNVKPWERPAKGARFNVIGFREGLDRSGQVLRYFLALEGWPVRLPTIALRKVRPLASEESEVVERILSAKPGQDRVRRRVGGV